MVYIIDESQIDLQLMHEWYILGTLVKELASSMIGTWFMVDMAYMYVNTY